VITTLRITGMTCNGCVRHVGAALRAVPGVTGAEVALPDRASVTHGEATTVAELVTAVESAGYGVSREAGDPPIRAS
jgi:copper chaperone CopZ